ncbi:hypothetical protein BT96DRAFT_919747 [Gymnopus androsaceus JB14]|uniref:Uncharacterized protein n=1 Tax=Gymnopus androsaceus JB14 TaxID=1447944 RepID=A0A6A4HPQ3_9AGAR|nr:hypothetical protein BT96DRAFT_919747 [Gymnopus androsaceus JB14]
MIFLHTGICSLRELHLTDVDNYSINLVGLGIEISYPPLLSTILVELNPNKVTWFNDYGLPVTAVTIDMDDERFWYLPPDRVAHDLNIFLRGFEHLPDSVCDISFDFDAGATDGPADCDSRLREWDDWDQVLINRYQRGLLNRVWFQMYDSDDVLGWTLRPLSDRTPDLSILDRVRKFLTQSDKAGIIEVDYSRYF